MAIEAGIKPDISQTSRNELDTVPSLVRSDPDHRHLLAAQYFPENFDSVLDVGGSSEKLIRDIWKRDMGSPGKIWQVRDITKFSPVVAGGERRYVSMNIPTGDYREDRRPDILYGGRQFPILPRAVDLAVSVDTFEHMDNTPGVRNPGNNDFYTKNLLMRLSSLYGRRVQVLSEMMASASQRAVVTFPFASPENQAFEDWLQDLMERNNVQIKPALAQHAQFGLPDVDEFQHFLSAAEVLGYAHEIHFATDRSVLQSYFELQVHINAYMRKGVSREQTERHLQKLEKDYFHTLNILPMMSQREAYRAILVVTPPSL